MNHFVLKHYYFHFLCDCKWHKINFLDCILPVKPWRGILVSGVVGTNTLFKREE